MGRITLDLNEETYSWLQINALKKGKTVPTIAVELLEHAKQQSAVTSQLLERLIHLAENAGAQALDSADLIREERAQL